MTYITIGNTCGYFTYINMYTFSLAPFVVNNDKLQAIIILNVRYEKNKKKNSCPPIPVPQILFSLDFNLLNPPSLPTMTMSIYLYTKSVDLLKLEICNFKSNMFKQMLLPENQHARIACL